jgi:hypothetical protein
MRGLVRAFLLPGALVSAVALLAGGCTATLDRDAGSIGAHDTGCVSCSAMSPRQFQVALARLRAVRDLRADIFVGGGPEFFPVALPLRTVEGGATCTVVDAEAVAKLVTLMSALEYSPGTLTSVRPVVEIRFYRPGHASERPLLEAFFSWGFSGGPFKEGAVQTAIVNGQLAIVDYAHLSALEDFASDLTAPPGDKACETSENK